jgi:hypothetical protein
MSTNFGTLDLPVRKTNWKAATLAVLSAMLIGTGAFVISQVVTDQAANVTRIAPVSSIPRAGIENPSLYAPLPAAVTAGGIENPSLYAQAKEPVVAGGIENPSLYTPRAVTQPADPFPCPRGKVGPC